MVKMILVWVFLIQFLGASTGAFLATYYGTEVEDLLLTVSERLNDAGY